MRYDGTCYIGVVGPDNGPINAYTSILNIERRGGDGKVTPVFATKGYEARQRHFNKFMASEHDFMLLLDHDMIFEPDTLERLRSHGEPFVSGYYMRRRYSPMVPIWFKPYDGRLPLEWFLGVPERGRLHEIGASGWGCILIHRAVVEATREILKGEDDVIEDDMDVWPHYPGETPRPLRGIKEPAGSDVRYAFYAHAAGFQLMGDPDVRPGHIINYPLTPDDYEASGGPQPETVEKHRQALEKARAEVEAARCEYAS